jgi:uncharacterized protein YceH (UPF0502 family)
MDVKLSESEARVLGCLVEKALTTPDYYPLTLNSLTSACNQKSNRNPVMSIREPEVVRALDSLRRLHLVWETQVAGSRVAKYEHNILERWQLRPQEVAVLGVLLLRGPQTLGEIRARTGRMFVFQDLAEVENTLRCLESHDAGPFTVELPRLPGHKESRFAHLLCGQPEVESIQTKLAPEQAVLQVRSENERVDALEEIVQTLQDQVNELKIRFEDFKSQFD